MAVITASEAVLGGNGSGTAQAITSSPGVTPTGADTATYVAASIASSGNPGNYWDAANFTNSSGTAINDFAGSNLIMSYYGFAEGYAKIGGEKGTPTGAALPIYVHWPVGFHSGVVHAVHFSGVDQTTPYGAEVRIADANAYGNVLPSGLGPHRLTLTFTGLDAGQRVAATFFGNQFGTNTVASVASANGDTDVLLTTQGNDYGEPFKAYQATITGEESGTGSVTLAIDVTLSANDGSLNYAFAGVPLNDAAGGGDPDPSSITAAVGAATASSMVGASSAAATRTAAAGAATGSTRAGSALAAATRTAAAGAATSSTRAGSSLAVASFVAAAGAATPGSMSSTPAPSSMAAADGAATAGALPGQSVAEASFVSASGAASTATMVGSPGAESTSDVPGVDFGYSETSAKTPKWWAKSGQQDEPEAEPPKAEPKPKREAKKAHERAKQIIEAVAREQVARGDVPKSARFAEVRSQIKPLGGEAVAFNWPALYERLYAQALTDAIRQEMAAADAVRIQHNQRQEEEALLLLLAEA